MHLRFDGLSRPVSLLDCDHLVVRFAPLLNGWRHDPAPDAAGAAPRVEPAITVCLRGGEYQLVSDWTDGTETYADPTDIICALFADLIMAYLAEDDGLVSLHAAAVSLAGRLLVFPAESKVGKSTLTCRLAGSGGRVFSDDVLPVSTANGRGVALGIAPRLRLPLPESIGDGFAHFVETHAGLRNHRYAYLDLPDQGEGSLARRGEEVPIAAFVLLERGAGRAPALQPESRSAVLRMLIRQNFGGVLPAAEMLEFLHRLVMMTPCLRLRYREGEEAAALLDDWARGLAADGHADMASAPGGAAP